MKVDFNTDADHVDVPLSKYRLGGYLIVLFGAFVLGLCFVVSPSTFVTSGSRYNTPEAIFIIGLLVIMICGPLTVNIFYRIFVMKSGLTIDMDGIMNNSYVASCGLINWNSITKINKEEGDYPMSIVVHVNSPEEFIQSQSNIFKRRSATDSYKKYGSPAVINTNFLKCDYDELYWFLTDTLKTYEKGAK